MIPLGFAARLIEAVIISALCVAAEIVAGDLMDRVLPAPTPTKRRPAKKPAKKKWGAKRGKPSP